MEEQEYSNFRIRNSNSYHKIKFKIHIVKITDDDLFEKIFNKVSTVQEYLKFIK